MSDRKKPSVLIIEIGMKNVELLKKELIIKNAEITFESNFIKIIDLLYKDIFNIILISDMRGIKSTKIYINLLKKRNPLCEIIIVSVNNKIDTELKSSYISSGATEIFSHTEILNIKDVIILCCEKIKKSDWFKKEWSKCTKKAVRFIKDNYDQISDNLLEEISKNINYSKSTIHSLIKKETGKRVSDWLRESRIKASIMLLKKTNANITKISKAVGYRSLKGFIEAFKIETNFTPRRYKSEVIKK